ncbi:GAP family protein [Leptolyngbya sp. FACHB-321]|uniref:GAP family protein n=1 Tax=Leptolyngbya sp. FACHB-321 TaxID=2692807 RepID=UPI001689527F|nr:GAP family protein [Leptolyngbya sp. FACHB-321]MBD2036466.1 GAP family protein [Leptolyngbya sp. FACHB-321]
MSIQLTLSFLILAVVDSLNPSIILMTLYLLSTKRPEKRTASYIFAVFVTNWTLGLLVYFGLGATLSAIINRIIYTTSWWAYAIQFVAAVALLIAAVRMKTEADTSLTRKPKKINPVATFSLGVGLTFLEFSTAAPYLGAIAALTKAAPPTLLVITALGLYNIIYVGIPLTLFSIFLFKHDQAQPLLTRINLHVSRWIKKIMKVAFFILGVLLLADFVGYLLGHPFLVPQ